ncbi:unnamed protein product, partial [Heterosigma akashiwo]
MFIEEVIIDGFKSYATRTVVSGFDPAFNAITGLNGSGKSNILDSICFVLGISNLSQVRVGNLQELVYKQGQAGVTKASVTIVFNNQDKKGSPVGYEHFDQITVTRQVVIGGKNKYLVNGAKAQAGQVQNLFHSVQLNVNNPHFLIMQGRITKVLNMKPPEILGMIEEAAGTRMFENKKQGALKTIAKKQSKVDEINSLLADEITPTLERLRGERAAYLRWQQNAAEIDRAERFCVAADYVQAEKTAEKSAAELRKLEEAGAEHAARVGRLKGEAAGKKEQLDALAAKKEGELGAVYQRAKAEDDRLSKELVGATTKLQHRQRALADDLRGAEGLRQQVAEAAAATKEKEVALEANAEEVAKEEAAVAAAKKEADRQSDEYQKMCAGVAGESADTQTLAGQISTLGREVRRPGARPPERDGRPPWRSFVPGTTASDPRASVRASVRRSLRPGPAQEALASEVRLLGERLGGLTFDESEEARLADERRQLERAVDTLREEVDRGEAQLAGRLAFEFRDPEPRFDRARRVRGPVARLVRVAAGGKLYQVVVDTEQTGKLLLEKGKLKKRVTIIPLNKISRPRIGDDKVARARDVAAEQGGTATPALELVGYEEDVAAAMEYAFGTAFVCDSLEVAKAVAFDRGVRTRAVTLEGDSFEPAGTLTGGARAQLGAVLQRLAQLGDAQRELGARAERLRAVAARLEAISGASRDFGELRAALELKEAELKLLEGRIGASQHATLAEKLAKELGALEESVSALEAEAREKEARAAELQREESAFREQREAALGALESKVKEAARLAARHEAMKAAASAGRLRLELAGLAEEGRGGEGARPRRSGGLGRRQLGPGGGRCGKRAEYEAAHAELEALKAQLVDCEKELKALAKEKEKIEKKLANAEIDAKKLKHKLEKHRKSGGDAAKLVAYLEREHPWIAQERQFFGRPSTDYDFAARDPRDAARRVKELKADQDGLAKKINKKVMGMIEKAETEYRELMHKREVIENDKRKIESVIADLDVKKNQALQTTWVKVNRDFGSIFGTLLPGTSAKLDPPQGGSVLDGLEVK